MNMHTPLSTTRRQARQIADPLADKLLAIDIAFDSIRRAQAIYKRLNPSWRPLAPWEDGPTPDGRRINAIRRRIHAKALRRAGLPVPGELADFGRKFPFGEAA